MLTSFEIDAFLKSFTEDVLVSYSKALSHLNFHILTFSINR